MVKIDGIWKHRCACGNKYQAENENQRKCKKCRKKVIKVESKPKVIIKEKPKPKPKRIIQKQTDPYRSCSDEVRAALMSFAPVKDFLNLPVRPNPYYD